ncbi:ankyrin repeat protein [Gregarina niphandrodes]|uniref:Ankyrin repeat protein n=1 Tax=Gregarina niphandrodes TaxID=110365 RepID=A0A023B6R6_GRENI|nr:ankyrin repeat protein [Gregarina niphandrodes]EZG66689.1 ankyrin repeat protein [Gregarina niphandrodes]|eukprot:XP_011130523.1 ankyrin repeat protein [Gregarina niphandrodes]
MPQGHLVQGNSARVRKGRLTPSHLFRAILRNDVEGVVELVETEPSLLSGEDLKGWTAVHYAARVGSVEIMDVLRDKGASTGAEDRKGMTPLAIATYHKHDVLVKYLLRKQLAAESFYGEAPAYCGGEAVRGEGRKPQVAVVAGERHRMSKGTIQRSLLTAAANAIRQDDLECLVCLSEKAKITKKAELDVAALCLVAIAADANNCLNWLLQRRAGLTGQIPGGSLTKRRVWGHSSLLHLAAKFGATRCTRVLLRQPCPAARARDDAGYTPLMYALALTKPDILDLLARYDPKTLDVLNYAAPAIRPDQATLSSGGPGGWGNSGTWPSLAGSLPRLNSSASGFAMAPELFNTTVVQAVKNSTPETRRFLKTNYHIDLEPLVR